MQRSNVSVIPSCNKINTIIQAEVCGFRINTPKKTKLFEYICYVSLQSCSKLIAFLREQQQAEQCRQRRLFNGFSPHFRLSINPKATPRDSRLVFLLLLSSIPTLSFAFSFDVLLLQWFRSVSVSQSHALRVPLLIGRNDEFVYGIGC